MRCRDAIGALAGKAWTRQAVSRAEFRALAGFFMIAAALFVFAKLASEVLEGDAHAFDHAVLLALRAPGRPGLPIGPRWLGEAARDMTALGSTAVLTYVTVAAAGFLALFRRGADAVLVLAAVGGGAALSSGLKLGFDRPRPDLAPGAFDLSTASFPSGHAMLSAVTYLTLGALLMRVEPRRHARTYVLSLAVLTTLLVGASRVYLGVHWPTDVLAGWSAGAAWALLCWLLALRLQRGSWAGPAAPRRDDGAGPC